MLHRETGRGKRDAKSNYDRHYREGLPAASNYRKLKFRSRLAPAVRPPREIMRVANRSLACTARERASTSPSLHLPSHGVEERTRGVQRGEKIVAARLRRRGCSCLAKSLKREKNTSWGILRVFQGSPLSL